ncbi:MAG TPA: glucose-6-phosphate isomerase [Candidatus Acidoferrum sp.]|nr:glucose-6-phosphate isomerase [Candidatus Acidoferrum sp.]
MTKSPEWQQMLALGKQSLPPLIDLFRIDPTRAGRYRLEAAGLTLDYSKNLLTDAIKSVLLHLALRADMPGRIAALFRGEHVNNTEDRPALHMLLRSPAKATAREQEVHATLDRMERFVTAVHDGSWRGHGNQVIRNIVNIGIGGSDLGPAMTYAALTPYHAGNLHCHFVSNVDPLHLEQTLNALSAESTLFVIASKTFTTLETMQNAEAARRWVLQSGVPQSALQKHFVAVSANVEKAAAFGIARDNIFPMWDWVGGRYSLWSAIGLPVALGVGMPDFRALLHGAHLMDEHFRSAELAHNMPVLLALLTHWYYHGHGAHSHAVLPYAQNLHLFPAFLQQLDMESLGKSVDQHGQTLGCDSGGILWGSAGTNGQHSFHQLLHQGTRLIPADFIAAIESHSSNREAHLHLLANCFAQSQALMAGKSVAAAKAELLQQGKTEQEAAWLAPFKVCPGNRPSNTLLMRKLTPATLGALVALYEHKVFAQSVLLDMNAFDQWGVELGKILSTGVFKAFADDAVRTSLDSSTAALVRAVSGS